MSTTPTSPLHAILARSNFSPITRQKYARIIDRWLAFAGTDPAGWTRPAVQAFYDSLIAGGVKPASANVYLASLRYVSTWWASQTGAVDFAVAQTTTVRATEAPRHALTAEEAYALLATCGAGRTPLELRDRALLVVGLETGMRRMSLIGARLGALRGHTLTVPIKGAGGVATYPVPLSDPALAVLAPWRAWLARHPPPTDALFPRLLRTMDARGAFVWTPAAALAQSGLYKLVCGRGAEAELGALHPHILRHTFITWRTAAGLSPIQIASITGHKTFGDEWKNMAPYVDMTALAEEARNSTPPWLANLIASWRTPTTET